MQGQNSKMREGETSLWYVVGSGSKSRPIWGFQDCGNQKSGFVSRIKMEYAWIESGEVGL